MSPVTSNQQPATSNQQPAPTPLRCPTCGQLGDAAEARLVTCAHCERENSTACCQPGGEAEPCWECAEIDERDPHLLAWQAKEAQRLASLRAACADGETDDEQERRMWWIESGIYQRGGSLVVSLYVARKKVVEHHTTIEAARAARDRLRAAAQGVSTACQHCGGPVPVVIGRVANRYCRDSCRWSAAYARQKSAEEVPA